MKEKIRSGTFETNSSSVHTISIDSSGRESCKIRKNKEGKLLVDFGSFDKHEEIFSTQTEKLSYLMTCCAYLTDGSVYCDERSEIIDNVYETEAFEYIEEAVMKYTGCAGIKIIGKKDPYLDHQSVPEYNIEIINMYDEDAIIDFIFNKYISLKTGCD